MGAETRPHQDLHSVNRRYSLPFNRPRALALCSLLFALPATAEDDPYERCRTLASDAERLECYDAVARGGNETDDIGTSDAPDSAPEPPAPAPAAAEPVQETAPVEAAGAAGAAGAAATVPEAAPAAETNTKKKKKKEKKKKDKKSKGYTAVVTEVSKRPYGQMVVKLDNGEVWSEQYASRAFLIKVGDTVTLKKAFASSGYRLIAPNGRGYQVTRLE